MMSDTDEEGKRKLGRGNDRGNPIYWDGEYWRYEENDEPIDNEKTVYCQHCKQPIAPGEPDPCLGYLPGVTNACCGHGDLFNSYVQFENGVCITGLGFISVKGDIIHVNRDTQDRFFEQLLEQLQDRPQY